MKSRKEYFKSIAKRYQFGYAEINNTGEIYLTSGYLQSHPETLPQSMPHPPFDINSAPEIEKLLNFTEGYCIYSFIHLNTMDAPAFISEQSMQKLYDVMDEQFLLDDVIIQADVIEIENKRTPEGELSIFGKCQIGINKPLTSPLLQRSFKFSTGYFSDDSRYSIILDFNSSADLHQFLDGISEKDKVAAKKEVYAIYECTYRAGCYQILIPYSREYEAILLLLGKNQSTANLPMTEYLLNQLKPTSFLMPRYPSLTDVQYKVVFDLFQKLINKQDKTLLSDFTPETQRIITANKGILKAFNDTVEYYKKVESLLETRLPKVLGHMVRQYF